MGFQPAHAFQEGKPFFSQTVYIPTGWAESNLDWLTESNVYPMYWWGDPNNPFFGLPKPEYYIKNGVYVCHGDWVLGCLLYEGSFRYRWWIFWEDDVFSNPNAQCLGGYFIYSHGTKDFKDIRAFGKSWVELDPAGYPFGYKYHVGLMFGGPK